MDLSLHSDWLSFRDPKNENFIHKEYIQIHNFRFSIRYYWGWEGEVFFLTTHLHSGEMISNSIWRNLLLAQDKIDEYQAYLKNKFQGVSINFILNLALFVLLKVSKIKHVYVCLTSEEIRRGIFSGRGAVTIKENIHVFSHNHHNESISNNLL